MLLALPCIAAGQAVEVRYFTESPQVFETPVETTFRTYRIPFDIVDLPLVGFERFELRIPHTDDDIIFPREYYLDNIRFSTNAFEDFESDSALFSHENALNLQVIEQANGNHVLQISVSTDSATIWIERPEFNYPVVPDSLQFVLQTNSPTDLWNYRPVEGIQLWRSEFNHDYGTMVEAQRTVYYGDAITWVYSDEWFSHGADWEDLEVQHSRVGYEYQYWLWDKIWRQGLVYDFDEFAFDPPDTSGNDTWLISEGFELILDKPIFVKKFTGPGIPGWAFEYGYGIGVIGEDKAGTNLHRELTAYRSNGQNFGAVNIPIDLRLDMEGDGWGHQRLFPADTVWHFYSFSLDAFYEDIPEQIDTLAFYMRPGMKDRLYLGFINIYGLGVWRGDELLLDLSAYPPDEWYHDSALNGSHLEINSSDEVPPGEVGESFEMFFYNDMSGLFAGHAYLTLLMENSLLLHEDDEFRFWMRARQYAPNSIDEASRVTAIEYDLHPAYPNPFNNRTLLRFQLPQTESGDLRIYSTKGDLILVKQIRGRGHFAWHGKDQAGNELGSGVYLIQLSVRDGTYQGTQKVLLLK